MPTPPPGVLQGSYTGEVDNITGGGGSTSPLPILTLTTTICTLTALASRHQQHEIRILADLLKLGLSNYGWLL